MDLIPHDSTKEFIERLAADPRVGRVTVRLRGASSVTGTIGPISSHAVIIKALSGREFYDAWVPLDSITAVEVQTRS